MNKNKKEKIVNKLKSYISNHLPNPIRLINEFCIILNELGYDCTQFNSNLI